MNPTQSLLGTADRLFGKQDQAFKNMGRIAHRHPAKLNHRRFKAWYRRNAKLDDKLRAFLCKHFTEDMAGAILVYKGMGDIRPLPACSTSAPK